MSDRKITKELLLNPIVYMTKERAEEIVTAFFHKTYGQYSFALPSIFLEAERHLGSIRVKEIYDTVQKLKSVN